MKKGKGVILVILITLVIVYQMMTILVNAASPEINFKGEWYSKGFGSYSSWNLFVSSFVNTIFKFTIENDNGVMKFGIKDSNGNIQMGDKAVGYNSTTGILRYNISITLPNGENKQVDYTLTLNGETDLRKVINPDNYYGKSIGDILIDGLLKGIDVKFVGARSNISITKNKDFTKDNPIIDINYQKNIPENFTSPIIISESQNNVTSSNNSNVQNSSINKTASEDLNKTQNSSSVNKTEAKTSENSLKVISPIPLEQKVSIFVNETKKFSVGNKEYDSINWYLDNKLVKKGNLNYTFKSTQKGQYNLSVEILRGKDKIENLWKVEVKEIEKPAQKKSNFLVYIIMGVILVVVILGILYFLKNQKKNE